MVDDEEFCLTVMKNLLYKQGVDIQKAVDFCISGKEALDKVKTSYQQGFNYQLILTDYSMPEMDGIESTRLIRCYFSNKLKIPRE